MIRFVWLIVLLAACTPAAPPPAAPAATADSAVTAEAASFRIMSVDEFDTILETQPDAYTIVNVHIPYEGEVPHTDSHVAFNDLDALTTALPDKNAPIILYCRTGRMSDLAAHDLVALGYTNVWDVPGGFVAWERGGRTLIYNE